MGDVRMHVRNLYLTAGVEEIKKEEVATKNVTKDTTTENAKEEKTTSEKK